MKTELKIKDHFLSKEHFFVSKCEDGVLKTAPDMDEKTLFKYYDSDEYISHNNRGGGIAFFYKVFSKLMFFQILSARGQGRRELAQISASER